MDAQIGPFRAVLPGPDGRPAVELRGEKGNVAPGTSGKALGTLRSTTAILYKEGKPALELTAPDIVADPTTHLVTARGGVKLRSLAPDHPATIWSDIANWSPEKKQVTGHGHVRLQQGAALDVPGESFTADTDLQKVRLLFGDAPSATGNL